ncbi:MAG: SufD family Fe-S cluster assembly protein [Eubacterium sp.]|nr:SufD family Fe-S cluster assembly protein [Eubacterium sp.]
MSEEKKVQINSLPAYTWYWLGINTGEEKPLGTAEAALLKAEIPEGFEAGEEDYRGTETLKKGTPERDSHNADFKDASTAEDPETGSGREVDRAIAGAGIKTEVFTLKKARMPKEALRLGLAYKNGDVRTNSIRLDLEESSQALVVMDYTSDRAASGKAIVQTKIRVGKDALLRLVQVTRVGDGFDFINDAGVYVEEGGRLELIHLHLSGNHVYQGFRTDLAGDRSSFQTDIAYSAKDDSLLDMNYIINHIGRKTECQIQASGVLRDRANKIFRGTIDLRRGATGAVGDEKEDVLLMDDTVRNRTLPVILCTEEDVVGNHGATIGRLDEALAFYLESRGMNRDQIYEMMADARINAVASKIPDRQTREAVLGFMGLDREE